MTYYDDLTSDKTRVNLFKKAIDKNAHGITYDLGTGSGILAQFASKYANKVYAIEQNPFILKKTKDNLSKYDNIQLMETDAQDFVFPEKADVIICEMLDTALIDEEQVPVINNALNFTKENCIFIPKSVENTIQLVNTHINHITYYEDSIPEYKSLSDEVVYDTIDFSNKTETNFSKEIRINVLSEGIINAIKLTTYTYLTEGIVHKPTSMLNPPLLIPVDLIKVNKDDKVIINLNYVMGGGLNTICANIKKDI